MALLGRNINVINLAGMSFAIGMVVDNAIVALENIFATGKWVNRVLKPPADGAREVWGAMLASTLTTVAIFLTSSSLWKTKPDNYFAILRSPFPLLYNSTHLIVAVSVILQPRRPDSRQPKENASWRFETDRWTRARCYRKQRIQDRRQHRDAPKRSRSPVGVSLGIAWTLLPNPNIYPRAIAIW